MNIRLKSIIKTITNEDLFKESSVIAISSALGALSRFLLVTILARYLSPESYGVWVSITSIAAIMMFGDLGITNSLRNKLSYLLAKPNDTNNEQREYFYTAFYFFFALASLITLIFVILVRFDCLPIDSLFNTNDLILKQKGRSIFIYIQIIYLMSIPFGMSGGLFYSYKESYIAAKLSIVNNLSSLIVIIFFALVWQMDIVTIAFIYFSISFVFNVFSLFWFIAKRKWFYSIKIPLSLAFTRFWELLKSGIMFLGVQLSNAYILNMPTVFLGAAADLKIAASYNIIQKLYMFLIAIYQSAFNPIWSKMAYMAGSHQWNNVLLLRRRVTLISAAVIGIAIVFFTIFSKPMVRLLVGEGYDVPLDLVFTIGISYLFYILFESTAILQSALNFVRLRMIMQLLIASILGYIFVYVNATMGYKSIPIVLSFLWMILFIILYFEANWYIRKKVRK